MDKCNLDFTFGQYHLPSFDVPEGYTAEEYLHKLCMEGFDRRYDPNDTEKRERLQYELDMIQRMGFVDYFLIVWDFIHYAKTHASGRSGQRLGGRFYGCLLFGYYHA